MKLVGKTHRLARHCCVLLAAFASGCATTVDAPEPEPEHPPIVVVPAPEPPPEPPVIAEPAPEPEILPPPEPKAPIAIIMSGPQPAYNEVAEELARRHESATIYDIASSGSPPISILRSINDAGASAVVAIGRSAAESAIAMSDAPVVFSQVFNYQALIDTDGSVRGVAAYAPLDKQLEAWRELDPQLSRIGMIVGEDHEALIEEARAAADAMGIDLAVHVSHSDQETLFAFRRMSRDIDGFWLFADNRILSVRALREISEIAAQQKVRMAVPNDALLSMGAFVSLATVATDVADAIGKVLDDIHEGRFAEIPVITELKEVAVTSTGATVAENR